MPRENKKMAPVIKKKRTMLVAEELQIADLADG